MTTPAGWTSREGVMYNQYFGFKEPPFRITPDPAFYYETAVGGDLLASVTKQIGAGNAFVTITGEPGTGKTTLLHRLICNSPETLECSLPVNPYSSVTDLLRSVLKNLVGYDSSGDRQNLLEQLHRYVCEKFMKGCTVALLFDEAQALSDEGLQALRPMLDQQRNSNNVALSIVLAGQMELDSRLNKLNLRHIKECITLKGRLLPLEDRDVYPYVMSRLEYAGYRDNELFEPAAVERLIDQSSGIPRLINIICDNALLSAYRASEHRVTVAMIDAVAHQLRLVERAPRKSKSMTLPINDGASTALPVLRDQIDEVARFTEQVSSESPDPGTQTLEVIASAESAAAHPAVDAMDVKDGERLTPASTDDFDPPAVQDEVQDRIPTREQTAMPEPDPAENFEKLPAMESGVGDLDDDTERKNQNQPAPFVGQTKTVAWRNHPLTKVHKLALPIGAVLVVLITLAWSWVGFYSGRGQDARPAANSRLANIAREAGPATLLAKPIGVTSSAATEIPQPLMAPQNSSAVQEERDQKHSHAPTEQESVKVENVGKKNQSPPREVYQISAASFLRNRPTADVQIIDTLQPGTRVAIINRAGEFFRIRSLGDEKLSGFVHREDAFFERVP